MNEEKSIARWARALLSGTRQPDEVVVVDAGSTDATVQELQAVFDGSGIKLKIHVEPCNISRGRNLATQLASHDLIMVTDAGCYVEPDWFEILSNAMAESDWGGGYYRLEGSNPLQRAYVALFSIDVSQVSAKTFLPSSRSFAYRKSIWNKVGGYNEAYEIGEDTEFCLRLRQTQARFVFAPEALVWWEVRDTWKGLWRQHFRYAFWDGKIKQNTFRIKHMLYVFLLLVLLGGGILFKQIAFPIAALAAAYLKATQNIRRARGRLAARPYELAVHIVVMLASTCGYIAGITSQSADETA